MTDIWSDSLLRALTIIDISAKQRYRGPLAFGEGLMVIVSQFNLSQLENTDMKLWLVIVLAIWTVGFSNPGEVRTTERRYFERGHHYLVEYTYATDDIVPQPPELSTDKIPPKIHYEAEVTVFDVTSGARVAVGKPFEGLYTVLGCIEDAPPLLVHRAMAGGQLEMRKAFAQQAPR